MALGNLFVMDLAKHIRLTHILTSIFCGTAWIHATRLIIAGHPKLATLLGFIGFLHLSLLGISRLTRGKFIRPLFLALASIGLHFVSAAMGEASHVYWMYFSVALIPMLIFDRSEKWQLAAGLIFPLAGYVWTMRTLISNPEGKPGFSNPSEGLYIAPLTVSSLY